MRSRGHRPGEWLVDEPGRALYDGRELSVEDTNGPMRMAATAPEATGESKLNIRSEAALAYLEFLAARQADFAAEARLLLGRDPEVSYRYRNATNGLALILTPDEAAGLGPVVRAAPSGRKPTQPLMLCIRNRWRGRLHSA